MTNTSTRKKDFRVVFEKYKAWIYLSPAIILLLIFTVWPIINTLRMAFWNDYSIMKDLGGYLDFEFVKGKLEGTNRFLTITSEFLKGKLDISDYAEMYHLIKVDMVRNYKSELYDRLNSL